MAKIHTSYGTPPSSCIFNDWSTDDLYNTDFTNHQLFEDMAPLPPLSSIHSDIKRIESDDPFSCGILTPDYFEDDDIKTGIRNLDCMWSCGSETKTLSTSASSSFSDSVMAAAVPLAVVTGNTQNINNNIKQQAQQTQQWQQHRPPTTTVVVANNSKHYQQIEIKAEIKLEPNDDFEQQLQQHNIPNSRTVQQQQQQQPSMKQIPAGTSLLLRKCNAQQQQPQQRKSTKSIQIPKQNTNDFLNERDQLLTEIGNSHLSSQSSSYLRPDTPTSLDDDSVTTEFKHSVDLRACVMGSNNISLAPDRINYISQQLQDTSKDSIDAYGGNSLAEVLDVIDVIGKDDNSYSTTNTSTLSASSSLHLPNSDCDSDEESTMGSSCGGSSSSMMEGELSYSSGVQSHQEHSDHSYTRCKDGMDMEPHMETPSDSEEEIDVVSIGDKKLPTNPSDKDRRALQTKVAHKFSNARIVKTANGVRTIPPRRKSFELPYTPASNSPVKSVVNSRYPSPAATPYQNQYTTKYVQQQQQLLALMPDGSTTPIINVDKSRKRMSGIMTPSGTIVNGIEYALPPNKKHRGKKGKHQQQHGQNMNTTIAACGSSSSSSASSVSSGGLLQRHHSLDEVADTLEKRNLHNDMERQRRIGLKNLFEALKKQIPSIKDKERAPKVNILREAAKLCESLTREDQLLNDQKALLKEQLRKRQELLARLRRD